MSQSAPRAPLFRHLRSDLPAALVVFLVALPLCLGIALASGAPPIAGVMAGVVGGMLVGALSGSPLGVSGPAAGLVAIVLTAIAELGTYELFLMSVVLSGVLQIVMSAMRLGVLAYYFPSSVIKGMLAGIGIIIILKQIPHAVGYDHDYEGDESFEQFDHETTLSALRSMVDNVTPGAVVVALACLAILLLWEKPFIKNSRAGAIPGPLVAVAAGLGLGQATSAIPSLVIDPSHFVALPNVSLSALDELFVLPDFRGMLDVRVWKVAGTIALVASLETLLCVEATDKLDPDRRVTPTNRELWAQGAGNIASGLIGGLPITQVVVRSSANIQSGGRTKLSAILHGVFLLLSLLLIPGVLRMIPLACLAAVLLLVGYKLAKPALFVEMWSKGRYQFIPFVATVIGVVRTDLLTGVLIGLAIGGFTILYNNYRVPFHFDAKSYVPGEPVRIRLSEDVSFLNKASVQRTLSELPRGAHVILDASGTIGLDPDVEEIIRDAAHRADRDGVVIELVGFDSESRMAPRTVSQFHREVLALRKATGVSGSRPPEDG